MSGNTTATATPVRSGPAASASARLAELFPDDSSQPRRRWWRRGRIVLALAIVLLVTVLVATEAFGSSTPNYVTASVSRQNVASTLTGVATIEPTSQATVAFPVSGTVATIDVEVNDTVSAGQVLATLDPTSLNTTLHQKELTLAQAQLTLSKALAGESVSGGGGSSPSGSTSGNQTTGSPTAQTAAATSSSAGTYVLAAAISGPGPGTDPAIAAAQQAVLDAQKQVDVALAEADAAMASANAVCAGITTPSPSTTTATSAPDPITACANALAQVQVAQKAVSTAAEQLGDRLRRARRAPGPPIHHLDHDPGNRREWIRRHPFRRQRRPLHGRHRGQQLSVIGDFIQRQVHFAVVAGPHRLPEGRRRRPSRRHPSSTGGRPSDDREPDQRQDHRGQHVGR